MMNPYQHRNVTKLKMVLPVGKEKAWHLIATTEGLSSWFPVTCVGRAEKGESLTFGWREIEDSERFEIHYLGEKHSAFRMEWRNQAELRFYLHGRMTTLTLEVEYPRNALGRRDQIRELPKWAFYLSNLKSIALAGPDLRHKLKGRSTNQGFID